MALVALALQEEDLLGVMLNEDNSALWNDCEVDSRRKVGFEKFSREPVSKLDAVLVCELLSKCKLDRLTSESIDMVLEFLRS